MAYTNVPYVLAAFRNFITLMELDNDFDPSTPCTVQKRASTSQGRALLSVWEKAIAWAALTQFSRSHEALVAFSTFAADLRAAAISSRKLPVDGPPVPLRGAATRSLGPSLEAAE